MTEEHTIKQKSYYDKKATTFENGILVHRKNRNHILKIEKIAEVLDLQEGSTVLEVGTGTGIHAAWLMKHKKMKLIGLDISESMLKKAKEGLQNIEKEISFVVGEGQKLPFKDNTFDAAFCSGTLHHFSNPEEGIVELVRVTKIGGNVAVMEPNWLFPSNFVIAISNTHERNILKMRIKNLRNWGFSTGLEDLKVVNHSVYTPPSPEALIPFYNKLDSCLSKIPILSSFSIMLLLKGKKGREKLTHG